MPTPSVRVNVTDIENGTVQPAGNHGVTYPTPISVTGMTCGGSGSQLSVVNTTTNVGSKSHHHE